MSKKFILKRSLLELTDAPQQALVCKACILPGFTEADLYEGIRRWLRQKGKSDTQVFLNDPARSGKHTPLHWFMLSKTGQTILRPPTAKENAILNTKPVRCSDQLGIFD